MAPDTKLKSVQHSKELDTEQEITLGLLNVIHENSKVSQRNLSQELNIALGLVNSYLKRCIKKGWIKVAEAPANRYLYYLTPRGFAEKSNLTREYLSQTFQYFREAREQCSVLFGFCAGRGWDKIVLFGVSDLAEIATLCAGERNVDIVAIVDSESDMDYFANIPVKLSLSAVPTFDAILLTDIRNSQNSFQYLVGQLSPEKIFVPAILNVSTHHDELAE